MVKRKSVLLLFCHTTYFIRQFLVFVLFVGYCFGEIMLFGTAMYIRKVFFVFLFVKVMSGRLKGIVLSVSMLRFQYSLKLFASTLAGVYIQGDSGGICITLGNDSMSDSKQKSSYEHGSDFERLRSYGHFLIPVHALM